ncbi:hypothetical protein M5362_06645 [Streptomyces sp. Je 1-79]|uniref:hypothetical protein n=1 Tax=Streptomyces sp. Je 1-79 TaxID=2943847 RepID=UPI0021A7A012|nr:hypothetical protein [Streptomyces sp. Je 1-79]MCT4352808.1 hypothetical protein [Streptomyces sp. Je 1-79]
MSEPRNEHHYEGPVIHGGVSNTQFAWNNETATQNQQVNGEVAAGYEALAQRVAELLRQLPEAGLAQQDREDAEAAAGEVLEVITQPEPEAGRVRRALATLRGALVPVASGVAAGTTVGAQEWARAAIEGLIA